MVFWDSPPSADVKGLDPKMKSIVMDKWQSKAMFELNLTRLYNGPKQSQTVIVGSNKQSPWVT